MVNITTVTLTGGLGTAGTGTISTLDNLIGVAGTPSPQVQTIQGVTSMTPLKVDGSGVTQPVSLATLPVTNAGTFVTQSTLAAETTKVIGVTRTADGSGNLITSTTNALDVNIKSGGGSGGTSIADEAAFTEGTTAFTPVGGVFKSSHTALTTGQAGALALSAGRHAMVDLSDGTGNALTSTSSALDVNVKSGGNANGRAVPGSSAPVVQASQTYQDVAASATATILGSTGATGDWLDGVLVIPETTAAGTVALLDNATSVNIFVTGTLTSLVPFFIPMGCLSKNGAWKITTGTNVHVRAIGNFT